MLLMGLVAIHLRVLVRKPEGKRPLGRPRCRWEDNIKIDVNKNPTRCNSMQIFIYCKVTLHVSGVTAPDVA